MSSDDLVHIAFGFICTFGGWWLKVVWDNLKELQRDIAVMNDKFVRRDDFKESIGEIKDMLNRIFEKLDGKADK
jgi:hypothetical protein